jgi:transcriptional regulator with XRE-family HTH domain
MDLLNDTIRRLKLADLTTVAKETGESYQWLWQIQEGKTKNPSITKIEKLNTFLKSNV